MGCFSLGVICDKIEDLNDMIYPFHDEFIGYYPKEYFDINEEEKKKLRFNAYSREIEKEWSLLPDFEKHRFNHSIERFADVKYGYYYNDEKSDLGYYQNLNGKMICFSIGGKFSGMLKTKGMLGTRKKVDYAKIKDIIIPDRKEKFGTYAIIENGKWLSVDDYLDRDEWFKIHFRRILKKADKEKLFVVVECTYSTETEKQYKLV